MTRSRPQAPAPLPRRALWFAWVVAATRCLGQMDGLSVLNWQTREGLPADKITSALQSRDGYIWAGSYEGLARFDGVSFRRYDAGRTPQMVNTGVTALCETPDDALWIGHDDGSVSKYQRGGFSHFPAPPDRKGLRVVNLAADAAGDVWALDIAGHLVRLRDGLTLSPPPGAARGIFAMGGSRAGLVWIIARGRLSVLKDGRLQPLPPPSADETYIHGAGPAADGGLWIVVAGRLRKYRDGAWSKDLGPVPTRSRPVNPLVELPDGRVAGGTPDAGAFLLVPGHPERSRVLCRATGFPSDWVTSVFGDNEGGVWLATGTAGLFRLSAENVRLLMPPDRIGGRAALSVTALANGEIWMGTEGSGVYRLARDNWTRFNVAQGITNSYVWSVSHDRDDQVWAGTWGSGALRFDHGHFVQHNDPRSDTGVAAMIPRRGGGMLVGSLQGIFACDARGSRWIEPGPDRKLRNVRTLLEDSDGTIWAGCHGEGLGRIRDGRVDVFTRKDGLSSEDVDCLHRDAAGALWIGTHGGGLNRLKDGRFVAVSTLQGLPDNAIEHIEEDGRGFFWMGSKAGVFRVAAADLNACADGRRPRVTVVTCGTGGGAAPLSCSGALQPAGARLPDGRLLFATDRGLALIDPAAVTSDPVPPRVWIESARAADHILFDGQMPAGALTIPPGSSRLAIRYTGLSFGGSGRVVFRRQLQPVDATPVFAGEEREAVYSYLPPGRYTFRVSAANSDGVWNEAGQVIDLIVQPHFWQTWWFRFALALTIIAATASFAWVSSRRRLQRQLERLENERAVERERTRIANDMHDDLGAHLTRITMLSESAEQQMTDPARLRQGLRQIYDTARSITRSMDEIVWAVNPKHDTLESLISYFEKFAVDYLHAAGIRCRLDIPLECPAWTPSSELRHQLFLCLKEALHNVVRHAEADLVTLKIETDQQRLVLVVADDGRGAAAVGASRAAGRIASGNGLENIRARVTSLGGACALGPSPEGGFVVELSVPLPAAEPAAAHRNL